MSDMVTFSVAMLNAIADFLQEPPLFYLVAVIILAFVVKIIMSLVRPS